MVQLPETGFLRLVNIIGDSKRGIPALIPVSKSSWWANVKSGRYPKPVKLSSRTTVWAIEDVRALIAATKAEAL
jgi:prophage regulatory protein